MLYKQIGLIFYFFILNKTVQYKTIQHNFHTETNAVGSRVDFVLVWWQPTEGSKVTLLTLQLSTPKRRNKSWFHSRIKKNFIFPYHHRFAVPTLPFTGTRLISLNWKHQDTADWPQPWTDLSQICIDDILSVRDVSDFLWHFCGRNQICN